MNIEKDWPTLIEANRVKSVKKKYHVSGSIGSNFENHNFRLRKKAHLSRLIMV